ncbi:MAG: hypothetical protein WCK86_08625, partial [Planctomycetia bacterium]
MATVSEHSRHSYVDPDQFIQYQVEQARSRIKSTDLLCALVLVGLLLVGYVLVFTLLDHWVVAGGFRPMTRLVLLSLMVIALATILYRYVIRRLDARVNPLFAARILDQGQADPDGSLLTLVDLQRAGRNPGAVIQKTLEKRAAVQLVHVHVDELVDRRWLVRMGGALFVLVLLTCLYAIFSPKSISLLRPLTLAGAHVATRTVLEAIVPGNTSVPAGTHLEFQVDVSGIVPDDVRVLYTTDDRRFVDEPLVMQSTDDESRFRVVMPGESNRGVRQDLQYRIVAGDAASESFQVRVMLPPSARVTGIRYQYPEYMNLPDRMEQSGMIEAWQDTTATITAESNVPLKAAVLQLSDEPAFASKGEEVVMSVDQTKLSAKIKLESRSDGTFPKYYRIHVTDLEDHHDPEPVVYAMEIRRDQPPVVRLLDPSRDLQVASNAVVPLLIEAEDPDFLLRNISLHYLVNGQARQPAEFLMDASSGGFVKRWAGSWEFQLSLLRLSPGDVVTYHIEARDNRPPLGNTGRTGELNLRIEAPISPEKVQEQLAQDREMQQQQLQDRREQQQQQQGAEASEQPQPAEGSEKPQQDGSTNPPDAAESAERSANAQEKSATERTPGNEAEKRSGDAQPRNVDQNDAGQNGNQKAEQQKTQNDASGKKKADDDEALQRLIESMNQQPDSSRSDRETPSGNSAAGNSDADPSNSSGSSDPAAKKSASKGGSDQNVSKAPKSPDKSGNAEQNSESNSESSDSGKNDPQRSGKKEPR